ncbi:RNA polymerase sigma-70 factor (ECF subfamily) [Chitinophaga terrae (ex Kim and Jung 2007)]|uniref:RNA polymerase sigma factor n=1 Tax=Chitinophaga terrae (ex Kim and Jung 2007) TaxID=408074 RepID=UPI00278B61B6|nr:sigma-70 family RNA polymerase sigma factor [Chitinophaga terrae (ex Kim and Jung 2007)]MDQ0107505.1 RNA polymerase sigma-70 factor (ECF subfamily) [Chitinophaga terrae (ex Kim and Jung 2007)]
MQNARFVKHSRDKHQAFQALYEQYVNQLYWLISMRIGPEQTNDVSDLVQEIFIRVWSNLERYDITRASLKTWIWTIANNVANDYLRARQRRNRTFCNIEEGYSDAGQAEKQMTRKVEISLLLRLLDNQDQQIIALIYFGGQSQSKIAEMVGCSAGSIKCKNRMIIKKLRGHSHYKHPGLSSKMTVG